jgi:DNA-binding XRE family transcriptional regulator
MGTHYSKEQLALFMKYINPVALAADSGIHSQTIRAISKGIVIPKIETMVKLSDFFDAQLDEINGLAERRGYLRIMRADVVEVGD